MNLRFYIKGQKLSRCDDLEIAGFARNYIYVTVNFDHNWIDLEKYALFMTPDESRYVVYLGYGKELSCQIPAEVLTGSYFKISFFGGDLMTSTQQTVPISASGYISDLDNLDEGSIISSDIDFIVHARTNWDDDYVPLRRKKFIEDEHPYL